MLGEILLILEKKDKENMLDDILLFLTEKCDKEPTLRSLCLLGNASQCE